MKRLSNRDLKALALLSVVVPVSLLITFRLTGILPEPEGPITIAETTTLDTIKWEFERPYVLVDLEDETGRTYDNEATISFSVYIDVYSTRGFGYGSDAIHMGANGTAFIQNGFISNVHISILEDYQPSFVTWYPLWWGPNAVIKNLSAVNYMEGRDARLEGNIKAFVDFAGINRPSSVSFMAGFNWYLQSPNNQSHQLDVVSEVVYFNGTVYKKVSQPFQLKLIGKDDNDSFETADEITLGSHKAYVDEDYDPVDYYNIWLEQGQTIQVESPDGVLNIYVYDSNRELVAESIYGLHEPRQIVFTVNSTGYWYIKTERHHGAVVYILNLIPIAESITLEAVEWEFERPNADVEIRNTFESLYKNENLSIKYGVYLEKFLNKTYQWYRYGYRGGSPSYIVSLSVYIEALTWSDEYRTPAGHIENVQLVMREKNYADEFGYFFEANEYAMVLQNLINNGFKIMPHAFSVNLTGADRPYRGFLCVPGEWFLQSSNNETYEMEILFDVIYFNGTVYKRIVQPLLLRITSQDDNNSFETADEIDTRSFEIFVDRLLGSVKGYVDRFDHDPVDYYKIWLTNHLVLASLLNVWGNFHNGLNMYIYDPNRELVAQSLYGVDEPREILFSADTTGWWYIKIEHVVRWEIYTLKFSILEFGGGG